MDGPLLPVDVAPLQPTALAPAHPGGDDELEVGLVFEAFLLQRGDKPLGGGLVGDHLLFLLSGVAVGPPSGVVIQKAALHGIGEDPAQTCVDSFNGAFGERLSCFQILHFPQIGVQLPEVFRPELCQLVVSQDRQEAVNVLPVPGQSGLGQLDGSNLPEPQLRVLRQRDGTVHLLRQALALPFE